MGFSGDIYLLSDAGMAHALMNKRISETVSLALTRIFVLNEILANSHYGGFNPRWTYFKSRKGAPIDLIWENIPIKIVASIRHLGWEGRAVHGAMTSLKSKTGLLVGPTDQVDSKVGGGVKLVPWTFWS